MKRNVVCALMLLFVFSLGFLSADYTEAKSVCTWERMPGSCCVAVGKLQVTYCCVTNDGVILACEIRIVGGKDVCPPGSNIC